MLAGGYSQYWAKYPENCEGNYTKMEGNFSYNKKKRN
jgi:hypothetical protein